MELRREQLDKCACSLAEKLYLRYTFVSQYLKHISSKQNNLDYGEKRIREKGEVETVPV